MDDMRFLPPENITHGGERRGVLMSRKKHNLVLSPVAGSNYLTSQWVCSTLFSNTLSGTVPGLRCPLGKYKRIVFSFA